MSDSENSGQDANKEQGEEQNPPIPRFWGSPTPSSQPTPPTSPASESPAPPAASEPPTPNAPLTPPAPPTPPPTEPPVFQPPSQSHEPKRGPRYVLRPYTVADILDLTFGVFRDNWKLVGVLALLAALPNGLITAAISAVEGTAGGEFSQVGIAREFQDLFAPAEDLSATREALALILSLLTFAVAILWQPLIQGAITRAVAARFVNVEVTAKQAFNGARKLWLPLIGASILTALCTFAGVFALFIGMVIVWVLFSAVTPALIIEEDGVFNALGRSWALMKRRFWAYLAVRLIMMLLTSIAAFIVVIIPLGVSALFYNLELGPIGFVFMTLGYLLAEVVVFPIVAIAVTLMYFDARVRFEGFDVQLMAARLPQEPKTP